MATPLSCCCRPFRLGDVVVWLSRHENGKKTQHRRKYSTAHPHLTATQTNSTLARAGMRRGQQRGNVKDFHAVLPLFEKGVP
jgi:hypothetical protein